MKQYVIDMIWVKFQALINISFEVDNYVPKINLVQVKFTTI